MYSWCGRILDMGEYKDDGQEYPFEIELEKNIEADDLTIDVELGKPASKEDKQKLENLMVNWAKKGISKGHGKGKMHDWNEDANEWDKEDKRYRFWVDLGSDDEKALAALCDDLSDLGLVNKIKIGSRYDD